VELLGTSTSFVCVILYTDLSFAVLRPSKLSIGRSVTFVAWACEKGEGGGVPSGRYTCGLQLWVLCCV